MRKYFSFGLTGYPLDHSLSPRIHTAALQALGLQGDYRLYPVEEISGLNELLSFMRRGSLVGLNVTIPHKGSIYPLLDNLTPTTKAIGAVNTIYLLDEQLVGDNTDASGFLADLNYLGWSYKENRSKRALILGAGGSARAVVYGLTRMGWQITVAARRLEQARGLVEIIQTAVEKETPTLKMKQLTTIQMDGESLSAVLPSTNLIINTTPLGMYPHQDDSPWPSDLEFPPEVAVYDLVYNPAETPLIRAAKDNGLRATNGLGMLIEQAALSFKIWTGLDAPREMMRQAVQEYKIEV